MARGTSTSRLHPPAPLSPPYFDAGYPHGHDQFLSMQGASWAVMALSYALEPGEARCAPPALPETEPAGRRALGRDDDLRHASPTCGGCSTAG